MLIYLICVGAVLQGDGNWLYHNGGHASSLQSAVIIEVTGLIFSIFFSVSVCVCVCVCVHARARAHIYLCVNVTMPVTCDNQPHKFLNFALL